MAEEGEGFDTWDVFTQLTGLDEYELEDPELGGDALVFKRKETDDES